MPTDSEIERLKPIKRALVWYVCTIQGCEHYLEPRPVYEEDEEDGRNKIWHTEPGFPAFEWDKPVGTPWPNCPLRPRVLSPLRADTGLWPKQSDQQGGVQARLISEGFQGRTGGGAGPP